MKRIISIIVGFILQIGIIAAQDTMFVHQHGGLLTKIAVNKIDSIVFNNSTGLKTKLIVIDINNVTFLSDSVELSNGIYKLSYSGIPQTFTTDDVIVGQNGEGYLLKVKTANANGKIVKLETKQATFEDLYENKNVNFQINTSSFKAIGDNEAELEETKTVSFANGITISKKGISCDISNTIIYDNGLASFTITKGNVIFTPHFVFNIDIESSKIKKFAFYADSADLTVDCNVNLTVAQALQLADYEMLLFEKSNTYKVVIGEVPIIVVVTTKMKAKLNLGVSTTYHLNTGFTNTEKLTFGILYDNGIWTGKYGLTPSFTQKNVIQSGAVQVNQNLSIIPEISVKLYGVAGPYCIPKLWEQFNTNVTSSSFDWDAKLKAGITTTVGANVKILGNELTDFSKTYSTEKDLWNAPDSIIKVSGDIQTGIEGEILTQPLKVRVVDNLNKPLKNVVVYFSIKQGDGSFSQNIVLTDVDGLAESFWTMGANKLQEAMVTVKKADGSDIISSNPIFTAIVKTTGLAIYSGDNQVGQKGKSLTDSIKVIVADSLGNPIEGVKITFSPNNNGSVSQSDVITNINGIASTIWTLGLNDKNQTLFVTCFNSNSVTPITGSPLTVSAVGECFANIIDGYETVTIGNQVWMAKNMNIPSIKSWCYDDDSNMCKKYGRLYTFSAALSICPVGWHLPSDAEWEALEIYLGGSDIAGTKLKETDIIHWTSPNSYATNETCFNALPGAVRSNTGTYANLGNFGRWWSSTEDTSTGLFSDGLYGAYYRGLSYKESKILRSSIDQGLGMSVRCLKNN